MKGLRRRIWRTERSSEGGQVEHVLARGESETRGEYRNTISLLRSLSLSLSLSFFPHSFAPVLCLPFRFLFFLREISPREIVVLARAARFTCASARFICYLCRNSRNLNSSYTNFRARFTLHAECTNF